MQRLSQTIVEMEVPEESLAIFWLGQAGFALKTPEDRIIYIDPYLSDSVERLLGVDFKRIMPAPITADEVVADMVIMTHHHEDHLDIDTIPAIADKTDALFVATPTAINKCRDLGIENKRLVEIEEGTELDAESVKVRGVHADHGELAPDAVGVVLDFGFVKVYHTGDTAYRPEDMEEAIDVKPEVILPAINGRYGNMNPVEAAMLANECGSKVAIPCHFWMFPIHNGDPASFIEACKEEAPDTEAVLLACGGSYLYTA